MKILIKYCGGCNSRYDRTREVKKLLEQFPQHTFVYAAGPEIYDICLLVCGCMTSCASAEGIAAKRICKLCTPREFTDFAAELQAHTTPIVRKKKRLSIGDHASLTKTFTAADIAAFAALTGDYGKLHTDPAFASQYGLGRPVVHGVLTGSLISSVMGMQLPGDGTILMDEQLRFTAPVYAGDTITATVTLQHAAEKKRWFTGELRGTCRNQDGILVADGICHQLMPKTLFEIETRIPGKD